MFVDLLQKENKYLKEKMEELKEEKKS